MPTLEKIIEATAEVMCVPVEDLVGRKREELTTRARFLAAYVMRQMTEASLKAVGAALGGRSPASISHAYAAILQSASQGTLKGSVEEIVSLIEGRPGPFMKTEWHVGLPEQVMMLTAYGCKTLRDFEALLHTIFTKASEALRDTGLGEPHLPPEVVVILPVIRDTTFWSWKTKSIQRSTTLGQCDLDNKRLILSFNAPRRTIIHETVHWLRPLLGEREAKQTVTDLINLWRLQ